MPRTLLILTVLVLFGFETASAGEVTSLAECATQVFKEINTTKKWSGRPPAACHGQVAVEKRDDGVFVTAWRIRNSSEGWNRISFSGAMGYSEIAARKDLARAGRDMRSRAIRLDRCLDSILSINDPQECRDRATKSYLAGEVSGIENVRLIWLDDNGRHTVAEYAFGNSSTTAAPPADLFSGERVLPGIILNLRR